MDMEETLSGAAIAGDTRTLNQLLQQDPHILDKAILKCSDKTPLHISAMLGHVDFTKAILDVCPDMCFARDKDGRNPLHLSAIKGRGDILQILIQARYFAVREKTDGGGTILHLCVKYNQLETLKILLEVIKDSEFLNAKNDEGMTILHLAVLELQIEKKLQTIRCLVDNHIDVNAKNANGKTALDMLNRNTSPEIARILEDSGALRAKDISQSSDERADWSEKQKNAILIVATLFATFAFQAGLSPTGGVWQEDKNFPNLQGNVSPPPLIAGEAIMAHHHPKYYKAFVRANTVAFVSSLSTIMLLTGGMPSRRSFFMWFLMVILWLTIISVACTYCISILMVTPKNHHNNLGDVIWTAVIFWCSVMSLLLLGNTIRLLKRWIQGGGIKRFRQEMRNRRYKRSWQRQGSSP